jgi:hypothetical protein
MFLRRILSFSLLAFSATALADDFDINMNDTSVQLQYGASMGKDTLGRAALHLGYLYAKEKNSFLDLGFQVKDELGSNAPGVTVGFGLKGLYADSKNYSASAMAIGGLVRYAPFNDTRFGIGGLVYLSPNIVTFGDADRYIETGAKLDYEVIPQAVIYLGYRKIEFRLSSGPDAILNEGAMIGLTMSF